MVIKMYVEVGKALASEGYCQLLFFIGWWHWWCGSAFAPTLAQDAHKSFLGGWVRTTSTVGQKSKTGRITALALGSY